MSAQEPEVSGWAIGGIAFAATLMVLIGAFQVIAGLGALFNDDFFVVTRNCAFDLDITAWGWIHLIFGLVILATGIGLYGRREWAGVTGLVLVMLSAIAASTGRYGTVTKPSVASASVML